MNMLRAALFLGGVAVLLNASVDAAPVVAKTPPAPRTVSATVDRVITAKLAHHKIPASGNADDAEFLRRVSLDITGKIPTAAKAKAFLDSKDPNKREKLIDELLASPDYGKHFGELWAHLIVNAGNSSPNVDTKPLSAWLAKQFNDGKGWDSTVREILTATGPVNSSPASVFYQANTDDNKLEPAMLASSTTQLFLGVQISCAECHAHPFAKWTQQDFWGLAAFYGRTKLQGNSVSEVMPGANAKGNKKNATAAIGDNTGSIKIPATGGNKGAGKVVPARLLEEKTLPDLKDAKDLRPVLAEWMTSAQHPRFARAATNRLWAHFLGAGFLSVDDCNESEPTHPEALAALTETFVNANFDLKHLIRCICNTEVYQRTSKTLPGNKDDEELFSHVRVKALSPEQLYDSLTTAYGVTDLPLFADIKPSAPPKKGNAKLALEVRGARDTFLRFYAKQHDYTGNTEYNQGIPQHLKLMNAPAMNRVPVAVEKLAKSGAKPDDAIEELYLAAFSRRPTADEQKTMLEYVNGKPDKPQAYANILWALVNSSEFALNR
jgi:hypothetical protein